MLSKKISQPCPIMNKCFYNLFFLEEETVFEEIKEKIADMLNVSPAEVNAESNLITDLKADSMDIATLLFEVEEQYGIEIDEDDLESLKTVGDIVAYIEKKKD